MPARIALLLLLLSQANLFFGQNKHISLGKNDNGLCFGNSADYNGIRFNLWDRDANHFSGLNISGMTRFDKSNGISIGIVGAADVAANGIVIGGLAVAGEKINGVAAGAAVHADQFNGMGIGILIVVDNMNGFFAGVIGLGEANSDKGLIKGVAISTAIISSEIWGVAIGTAGTEFQKVRGVTVGFYNSANELHGLQLGVINHAANNKGLFKWTPILNFHFGR